MIDLNRTVLVLDGPSDIKAFTAKIQKEYGANPQFRKAPCNGHTVSPEGYVNGIRGIVNLALNGNYENILCILDREKRIISAAELAEKISQELIRLLEASSKFKIDELQAKIKVVVADRMLENWIVADVEGLKSKVDLIRQDAMQKQYDGQSGTNVLKGIMIKSYDKVRHAPVLFKAVSLERAAENSPSFNILMAVLEDC